MRGGVKALGLNGAGLVLLAAAAAALSLAALHEPPVDRLATASGPGSPAASSSPSPAATATPAPGPTSTAPTSGSTPPGALPHVDAEVVLADVLGSAYVVGVTSGDCAGTSTLSWHGRAVPLPAPHLLRVKLTGSRAGWVVAADAGCAARLYATADAGQTWSRGKAVTSTWYLADGVVWAPGSGSVRTAPASGASPSAPSGGAVRTDLTPPCPRALQLAVASPTAAAAWCGDALRTTSDGGRTWTTPAQPTGAIRGIELVRAADVRVAATGVEGCGGIAVLRLQAKAWTTSGCIAAAPPESGSVALSFDGSRGLLATATATWRSTDGGRTWTS